jgi:hypothetical protein
MAWPRSSTYAASRTVIFWFSLLKIKNRAHCLFELCAGRFNFLLLFFVYNAMKLLYVMLAEPNENISQLSCVSQYKNSRSSVGFDINILVNKERFRTRGKRRLSSNTTKPSLPTSTFLITNEYGLGSKTSHINSFKSGCECISLQVHQWSVSLTAPRSPRALLR